MVPHQLKIAKVIPIHKHDNPNYFCKPYIICLVITSHTALDCVRIYLPLDDAWLSLIYIVTCVKSKNISNDYTIEIWVVLITNLWLLKNSSGYNIIATICIYTVSTKLITK